jgi:molybdate transport system regulatory protein
MEYQIKSRIWIEVDGSILLGRGRVNLLKAIEQTGSLSKAAKALKMSYKKAWNLVSEVNERAKNPVVETSIGGKGGGGAILTPYGKSLIEVFDSIDENCHEFLDQKLTETKL